MSFYSDFLCVTVEPELCVCVCVDNNHIVFKWLLINFKWIGSPVRLSSFFGCLCVCRFRSCDSPVAPPTTPTCCLCACVVLLHQGSIFPPLSCLIWFQLHFWLMGFCLNALIRKTFLFFIFILSLWLKFYCLDFFLFWFVCLCSAPLIVCVFVFTERPKECVWWSHIGCTGASWAQEETQMCAAMKGSVVYWAHTQTQHTHKHIWHDPPPPPVLALLRLIDWSFIKLCNKSKLHPKL